MFKSLGVSPNGFCCNICMNKLNKLKRYEENEISVLQKLKREKMDFLATMKRLPGIEKLRTPIRTTEAWIYDLPRLIMDDTPNICLCSTVFYV